MAGLAHTLAQLRGKLSFEAGSQNHLEPLNDFGSNPGALRAYSLVPQTQRPASALVVVLHGCTQNAASYDHGSGWSKLAAEHGFVLLFPEQQRSNNANGCFNWFEPGDIRRDSGEALSIRQMIDAMCDRHSIDPSRIYVTGLSAGGAMACAMLATYPEIFAGGAIIAGLPFDTAHDVPQALARMRGRGLPGKRELGSLVRAGSQHSGPWPTISIWHGGSDRTVVPSNAQAIIDQWRDLHDVDALPNRSDRVEGFPHHVWCNSEGRQVIEEYQITGLGHGTPLATAGEGGCGVAGPHMLEAGISSTVHIARGWRLIEESAPIAEKMQLQDTIPVPMQRDRRSNPPESSGRVEAVIEQALRAAGLMR